MPHDPYIFGPHGQSVTFPDQSDTGHSTKFGMRYYVRQLQFVNRKLLEATDAILGSSKVAADHRDPVRRGLRNAA